MTNTAKTLTRGAISAVRVAVADDHPMMRGGVVATLAETPGFAIVGSGGDADSAVRIALEIVPDILIIDLDMPGGAASVLDRLRLAGSPVRVVILSVSDDFVSINKMFDAGARGFISKGVTAPELIDAVQQAMTGAPFVTALPVHRSGPLAPAPAAVSNPFELLRDQEKAVTEGAIRGEARSSAANRLSVNENRISLLLANLGHKFRLSRRVRSLLAALQSRR